jgi:glucose-1-phosphate cytidylyltransferase
LWHILKIYTAHGVHDFIICCGYRGTMIKEYFANYFLYMSDVRFDMTANQMHILHRHAEPWRVTLVDTGEQTMTGGRLRRIRHYLDDEDFHFTYGDGVGDVDVTKLSAFHKTHGRLATLTAAQPPGRFGVLNLEHDRVLTFEEKPHGDGAWINAGFFVLSPSVIDLIDDDQTIWERQPMKELAEQKQLHAYFHRGFWQPMDTLRDKILLEDLWQRGVAPWKTW